MTINKEGCEKMFLIYYESMNQVFIEYNLV